MTYEILKVECEKLANPYNAAGRWILKALEKGTEKAMTAALIKADIWADREGNEYQRAYEAFLNA